MSFARLVAKAWFAAAMALPLTGCVGPTFIVQQYDGAPRPRERIAIIRLKGSETARLLALDGADANAPIESDVRLHIEVLPGEHSLHVADASAPEQPVQRLRFRAEPGRVYRIVFSRARAPSPLPLVGRVYEIDDDSDAPIRDVTLTKPER